MSELRDPLLLGRDCCLAVLRSLSAADVLALSACSRGWRELCSDDVLWRTLAARDLPLFRAAAAVAAAGKPWRAAYEHAHRLQSLRHVGWEQVEEQPRAVQGYWPRRREGHAACPWGRSGMLVCGGFGGGTHGDLHLLLPSPPAGPSGGGGAASSSAANGSYRWVEPKLVGRHGPIARYGHTLTRCGRRGELAVLFGGLMAGGYQAPLDTIAVLRRRRPPRDEPGGAAEAAGGEAEDADARGGTEEETSLGLRLGAGGQHEMLWAQMMLDFWAGGELWDEEEEEDEDEEEGSDFFSGSEFGGEDDSEEGSEDWRPARSGGSGGSRDAGAEPAPQPASAVAAMTRHRSGSLASSSGGSSVAAAGPAAGAAAGGSSSSARVATRPLAPAPGLLSPAAEVGDEEEQELRGDEEWEWFFPRTRGEAPGARGYHCAAASEDGTKVYLFGGIGAGGACATLAVLDVTTWEFSRPATTGTPPPPRCGATACVWGGSLWVVGGGTGRDLLRSGRDLRDVYALDLSMLEWRKAPLPPGPTCAGKCHASALVGSRLLLYGGSMAACTQVAWLDLEALRWGAPYRIHGVPPCDRMSATAVFLPGGGGGQGGCAPEVLVFGGYTFLYGEVGDLWRLRLLQH